MICPQCSARSWHVLRTENTPGKITRRRKCRQCGHRVTTAEKLVTGSTPDTPTKLGGSLEKSIAQLIQSAGLGTDGGLQRLVDEIHLMNPVPSNKQE
jgi:Zn ribbon nucleic-acid-binding protein